ncbi:ankyrin repeat domain-containing protein [Weizmannia acidilactici]|uniref:ankyrin repeat domain-containing protein n=1 Tax=Weizmannia acidilactici TaxID=2607726 RepID=UPI00124EB412|nr:ankyrin repeat domain-containing protein [Weizmannia acidilactici]GER75187.1 hypothetical protein BpPP18_32540 [Weizmannia acidilactici]
MDLIKIVTTNDRAGLGQYLDEHGGLNELCYYGQSVLHVSVFLNHLEMTRYILEELGADPNIKDSIGRTPLQLACYYSFYQIAEVLLRNGGSIDQTCYARAMNSWDGSSQTEIIQLLKEWDEV